MIFYARVINVKIKLDHKKGKPKAFTAKEEDPERMKIECGVC